MSSVLEITLVRHGETELTRFGVYYGITDIELSEIGRKQAINASCDIKNIKYDTVYCSDLKRAVQTAELITSEPLLLRSDLRELSFGKWEGLHYLEAQKDSDGWQKFSNGGAAPEGEHPTDAYNRCAKWLDEMKDKHKSGRLLVVTHHGCIRNILAHALGLGQEGAWHFKISPCGITKVELVDGYGVITQLNKVIN